MKTNKTEAPQAIPSGNKTGSRHLLRIKIFIVASKAFTVPISTCVLVGTFWFGVQIKNGVAPLTLRHSA